MLQILRPSRRQPPSTGTAFDVAVLWSGEIPTGEHDYHAGDFDGDGADDLLAWAYSQQQVALSTHTAFAPAQPWHTGDFWAGSLAVPFNIVHDIHGDGRADLLAPAPWGLYVLVSDGSSLGQVIYMQGAVDQTVDRGYRAGQLCRAHPDCG